LLAKAVERASEPPSSPNASREIRASLEEIVSALHRCKARCSLGHFYASGKFFRAL
jgi:hypothetical protein